MYFDRNINGNRDVKSLEHDYLLVQRCMKLTLVSYTAIPYRVSTGPEQGFPCVVNSHRENPVFITGNPCSHCRDPVFITGNGFAVS